MMTAGSPDPGTLHQAELDLLITDLVEAGFKPVYGDRHMWEGPITPSLGSLTAATTMRIEIRDGWPYLHPYIHADGLTGRRHVSSSGNTCLWFEDDDNYGDWLRLESIMARVDAWVVDQANGAPDPPLDAHLYFGANRLHGGLLTFDLDALVAARAIRPEPGASGRLRARQVGRRFGVGTDGNLDAGWIWHRGFVAPPTDPSSVRDLLSKAQQRTYDQVAATARVSRPAILVILWREGDLVNALGMKVERAGVARHRLLALEVARTDKAVRLLRSGPDAARMGHQRVAIFGVGAIGSEVALLLARSGVGRLVLVDQDLLRPGNLGRHAASGRYVGLPKPEAMAGTIQDSHPHVSVDSRTEMIWHPDRLWAVVSDVDLVIDATGNAAFTDLVSHIVENAGVPLVAVTLHRGGRVTRIRSQVGTAPPIWSRGPANGYPTVPAAPAVVVPLIYETGCGAPLNNAPPLSCASAAGRAGSVVVDILAGRDTRGRDIFEVREALESPPFDRLGLFDIEPAP